MNQRPLFQIPVAALLLFTVSCETGQAIRTASEYIAWDYVAMSAIEGLAASRLAQKYMPASLRGTYSGDTDSTFTLSRMDDDLLAQSDEWRSGPARIRYDEDLRVITHRRVQRAGRVALLVAVGQVREGEEGLLEVAVPDRTLSSATQSIIDAENRDRTAMFDALANQMIAQSSDAGQGLSMEEAQRIVRTAFREVPGGNGE